MQISKFSLEGFVVGVPFDRQRAHSQVSFTDQIIFATNQNVSASNQPTSATNQSVVVPSQTQSIPPTS